MVLPPTICKRQLQMIFIIQSKSKTVRVLDETIGGLLCGLGAGEDLKLDIKIAEHKGKGMALFDHIKIWSICPSE